jgi:outer membrane immunogenic protein
MRTFNVAAIVAAAGLALASSARADGWNGAYAGANAGGGWAQFKPQADPVGANSATDFHEQDLGNQGTGSVVGGQVGYDRQFGLAVLGVEADFDGSGINSSQQTIVPSGNAGATTATDSFMVHENINWMASLRAKAGVAWGPQWLYVTGGAAVANGRTNFLANSNTATGTYGVSTVGNFNLPDSKPGWVAGLGYERAVASNWSLRAEYLLYHFKGGNTEVMTFPLSPAGSNVSLTMPDYNVNVIRVGVNYRFGGAPVSGS